MRSNFQWIHEVKTILVAMRLGEDVYKRQDLNTRTGADIHIEQRPAEEVTEMWYKERMAPELSLIHI